MQEGVLLFAGLVAILAAAEFFTNGVEALGRHFSFSQAVVGSILAAVGTALPETILPLVAIFLYGGRSAKEIGVGAILGAPFMLSTLAFFLVGVTVTLSAAAGRRTLRVDCDPRSIRRDLCFFLAMYSTAVLSALLAHRAFHVVVAVMLVLAYMVYAYRTFQGESPELEHSEELYLWRFWRRVRHETATGSPALWAVIVQVLAALGVMVQGAHIFVASLGAVSAKFGMDPLLFALLLAPVATELPEKFNSVTWTWKGRDTLALGNITGAMVFQSAFPVTVGLLFTEWKLTNMAVLSALLALLSALTVLVVLITRKKVTPLVLLSSGILYAVYAAVLMAR
jgi:cation:H+ antiporter